MSYQSLASQNHSNWEWLVTDDCSSDGTISILNDIAADDARVIVFRSTSNIGAGAARNISLENATGRFLAFLDADDLWSSTKLNSQLDFMLYFDICFSFTAFTVINEKGEHSAKIIDLQAPGTIGYVDLLAKKATFGCSTVMIDLLQVPIFSMSTLRRGQDYVTWLSILKTGTTAHLLREPLTYYRITRGSLSRNKFKKALAQWMIYRHVENLPLITSIFFFCSYGYRSVFRGQK